MVARRGAGRAPKRTNGECPPTDAVLLLQMPGYDRWSGTLDHRAGRRIRAEDPIGDDSVSNSLSFALTLHLTPLSAFFWLFPALAALGSIAGGGQARQSRLDARGTGRHTRFAAGGILSLLALVTLALVPVAGTSLAFFELWPLAVFAVVAQLAGRPSDVGEAIPIALLGLGATLPAIALLVLGGSCHAEDLRALGACARTLNGPIPSLAFLLAVGGALGIWLGVQGVLGRLPHAATDVIGSSAGTWMADALSGMAFYPLLLVAIQLLGPGPIWWGAALILLGGALTLSGAIRGLGEESLSGLLATTGLAHQGMALLPLGAALVLRSEAEIAAAYSAESASLFLLLCCAVARCGLGIATEAVERAGSRRLGDSGGLWRRMPRSGTTLLVCALGAGLAPPLGGFAAGWLALHAMLAAAGRAAPTGYGGLALLGAGALLLGGALLLIAWIRGFGATFLGPPPLDPPASLPATLGGHTAQATGVIRASGRAGTVGLLMAGCVLLAGLIPGVPVALVRRALQDSGPDALGTATGDWLRLSAQPIPGHPLALSGGEAALIPIALLIAVPCLLVPSVVLVGLAGNRRATPGRAWATPERSYPAPLTPGTLWTSLSTFAAVLGWQVAEAEGPTMGRLARGVAACAARCGVAVRQAAEAGSGSRLPAAAWLLTLVVLLALAR